jgi:hypothetical protein
VPARVRATGLQSVRSDSEVVCVSSPHHPLDARTQLVTGDPSHPNPDARRQKGLATIELALSLPLLIAVLAGIVQFGGLFFVQNTMINVARDVTRRLAVGEITTSEAQSLVQAGLSSWTATFTVVIHTPPAGSTTDKDVYVQISVPKKSVSLMDIFGLFQTGNLTAKVVMRQEEDLS